MLRRVIVQLPEVSRRVSLRAFFLGEAILKIASSLKSASRNDTAGVFPEAERLLKRRHCSNQRAQSMLEYTLVVGLVVVLVFAMSTMIKRSLQGMIRVTADQIGVQANSDQFIPLNDASVGHLDQAYVAMRADMNKTTKEFVGNTSYVFGDSTETQSTTLLNLGFTEEDPP